MQYRSIVTKIIAVFFIIGIIPMLFFNLLYYADYQTINDRVFESNMTKILSEKSKVLSLTLSQTENSVENLNRWVVHDFSDLAKQENISMLDNHIVLGNNSVYIPNNDDITEEIHFDIELSKKIYPQLITAYEDSHKLGWMYIITKNDVMVIYPSSNLESFGMNHQFENDIYYYLADPNNNPSREVIWTEPYYDWLGQGWMITCTSPLYIEDLFYGVVAIDMSLESIQGLVKDQFFDELGYSFLINKNADIIYHPLVKKSQPEAGRTFYENVYSNKFTKEYQNVITKILNSNEGSAYYFDKKMKSSKYVVYSDVEGTNFILGIESEIKTNVLSDSAYGRYIFLALR